MPGGGLMPGGLMSYSPLGLYHRGGMPELLGFGESGLSVS